MLKKVGIIICSLCCFVLMGGHWAVLQTVAWANMIRTYSKDTTIQQAIEKTFDGGHPCKMCKQISASKKQGEKQDQNNTQAAGKLLAILSLCIGLLVPRRHLLGLFSLSPLIDSIKSSPPTPPPLAD
ncbi:MAG: hypothetical protein SGI98_09185 [Verrucomicrobiota bacterium]|nr:hypothetical protein [Verrucomicrobiota bacterium]